ncbi:uncharacterized protein LOC113508957 [Trichoplusia ni]|uniref:Uncharacterized protein LOC113508957 n=1 Tax=Trichoplusia ni TaxID=7111 RepID=A0A7E5X5Y8_TRINI|nr:uncharacterized protein LOC113508957 [Trichoplusia ni]
MIRIIAFLVTMALQTKIAYATTPEVTISVDQRIQLLKRQILDEMNVDSNLPRTNPFDYDYSDQYQYVDLANQPITPIQESDKRKKKELYKLPEIISRPTEKYIPSVESSANQEDPRAKLRMKKHRNYQKISKLPKPRDIFYRRMYLDDEERNKPQKWTHCLDLVTPFLNGIRDNMTSKSVGPNDDVVLSKIP